MSQNEPDIPAEVSDSPHFANLRRRAEQAEADRDAFKAKYETARGHLVANAVELAGFKPDENGTHTGVAGLLIKEFQGSLNEDELPDKQKFLSLAEQYGVKPEAAAAASTEPSAADQLRQLQATGDEIRQLATVPEPPSDTRGQIAAAEAAGDWAKAGTLKDQLLQLRQPA
jgi:hypothetical protein